MPCLSIRKVEKVSQNVGCAPGFRCMPENLDRGRFWCAPHSTVVEQGRKSASSAWNTMAVVQAWHSSCLLLVRRQPPWQCLTEVSTSASLRRSYLPDSSKGMCGSGVVQLEAGNWSAAGCHRLYIQNARLSCAGNMTSTGKCHPPKPGHSSEDD